MLGALIVEPCEFEGLRVREPIQWLRGSLLLALCPADHKPRTLADVVGRIEQYLGYIGPVPQGVIHGQQADPDALRELLRQIRSDTFERLRIQLLALVVELLKEEGAFPGSEERSLSGRARAEALGELRFSVVFLEVAGDHHTQLIQPLAEVQPR